MKGFYFSSTLMWDADAETLMRTAAENGFDGIELWAQHAETKKLDLETIHRLKKELGLNIVVHAKRRSSHRWTWLWSLELTR